MKPSENGTADARPEAGDGLPQLGPLLTDALNHQWMTFRELVHALRRKVKPERVHDVRVSIRRLAALLDLIHEAVYIDSTVVLRKRLKRTLRALGELRDAHVLAARVGELVELFPPLAALHKRMGRTEEKLQRRAHKAIRRLPLKALAVFKNHVLEEAEPHWSERLADRQRTQAMEAVDRAFSTVIEARHKLDMTHLETVHQMRIAFKKFRYMLEVLQPMLVGVGTAQMNSMHAFQGMMGDVHDLDVLSVQLASYRQKKKKTGLAPAQDEVAHRLMMATDSFMAASDEIFSFWNHAWFSDGNKN